MYSSKSEVKNWGNYPSRTGIESFLSSKLDVENINLNEKSISRGLGRSYGDSSLSRQMINLTRYNYFLSFSRDGVLSCTGGVSLSEIIEEFSSKGWFLPVTPGTKFVTVGGAIASDVHGKNHHEDGTFFNHVKSLSLFTGNTVLRCSLVENRDLFLATFGGMGLTGIVLEAEIQLLPIESQFVIQNQTRARNFEEIMACFEECDEEKYSVAWIDCLATGNSLGRGVVISGNHASKDDLFGSKYFDYPNVVSQKRKVSIPFNFPNCALNNESVFLFNQLYYEKPSSSIKDSLVEFDPFFYPLDFVLQWNKIYGKSGFIQYQFVLPLSRSKKYLQIILEKISSKGFGSFLAVLKLFGEENECFLSFPMKGYTLALDFPIVEGLFDFLEEIDKLVLEAGGRFYLAKDARMSRETFTSSYPNISIFKSILEKYNCSSFFSSDQSERLGI